MLQHQILSYIFDERLVFPPLNNPRRILECGHGAGTWAVEVAEQFPNCQVSKYPTRAYSLQLAPDSEYHSLAIRMLDMAPLIARHRFMASTSAVKCSQRSFLLTFTYRYVGIFLSSRRSATTEECTRLRIRWMHAVSARSNSG